LTRLHAVRTARRATLQSRSEKPGFVPEKSCGLAGLHKLNRHAADARNNAWPQLSRTPDRAERFDEPVREGNTAKALKSAKPPAPPERGSVPVNFPAKPALSDFAISGRIRRSSACRLLEPRTAREIESPTLTSVLSLTRIAGNLNQDGADSRAADSQNLTARL
jgi:hypothetical protein